MKAARATLGCAEPHDKSSDGDENTTAPTGPNQTATSTSEPAHKSNTQANGKATGYTPASDSNGKADMSTAQHGCEICGDVYPSLRAAWMCEERDLAEAKTARHPVRAVMRPAREWDDD